jgi:thiol-disulfide isomerase/thioredoxin
LRSGVVRSRAPSISSPGPFIFSFKPLQWGFWLASDHRAKASLRVLLGFLASQLGLHAFHSGNDWTFLKPVFYGDTITPESVFTGFDVRASKFAGKLVREYQRANFYNQAGELVAYTDLWLIRAERAAARSTGKYHSIQLPHPWTEEELKKALASGKPVLVDFGANSCVPCRQLRPVLKDVKNEYSGKAEILVIDVYKYQSLAKEYKIMLIPTLVFFDSKGKETFRHTGVLEKDKIVEPEPGIKARMRNSGHILGASILELWVEEGKAPLKMVFSGDLGKKHQLIVQDPQEIFDADYLLS